MAKLLQSLHGYDLAFLRIVAELWGIELESQEEDKAERELAAALMESELTTEILGALDPQARRALAAVAAAEGRLPWAAFSRQFGQVRDMGAGRRDREKPYLAPASPAEVLFYRALLFRAFFNTDKGPQEFAYIPEDLLPLIRKQVAIPAENEEGLPEPVGRGATPLERKHVLPATDRVLDEATTLLASVRLGREAKPEAKLKRLLLAGGLLSEPTKAAPKTSAKAKPELQINAGNAKIFLEASRAKALTMLVEAWKSSESLNELRLLPGLSFEGEWENQPVVTRDFLLDLLHAIPHDAWWSLNSFIADIKKKYPDFQRPAGDYDSWFIKRVADDTYLRGFAYWDQVDGALIRFFVTGVLHWLGIVDVARAEEKGPITAFHVREDEPSGKEERGKILIASSGRLVVPRTVPRAVRYQLSRFCEWDEEKADEYHYHLTPQSLAKAGEQGLRVEHLLALLAKHAEPEIPPVLIKALKRWEANGTEARAETQVILRVSRPEVLEELRKSKAARFLGEPLGPTSVVIKAGAQPKVMAALTEMGLLAQDDTKQATGETG